MRTVSALVSPARVTINDVADAAAVSRQTVSNALNYPDRVRPETLLRVKGVIDRLGYRHSLADLGMPASGIDHVVAAVLDAPYANPRSLTPEELRGVVRAAHQGAALSG